MRRMRIILPATCLFLLAACAAGDFKRPARDPQAMSADTLCYRGAFAKNDEAVQEEIAARRLDCARILESQRPAHERF